MKRRWLVLLLLLSAVLMTGAEAAGGANLAQSGTAVQSAELAAVTPKEIYAQVSNNVLYVRALKDDGTLKSAGSGFTVTGDGLTVTAAHVVKNAASMNVVLPDGTELKNVPVAFCDEDQDIAILRLPERKGGWPYTPLRAEAPAYGEAICAIGYPLRTVKLIQQGIVCAPEAPINKLELMLISTDIASGMSGGPVLGEDGMVIGMCSGTLRTMNGVSVSPTTKQLNDALTSLQKEVKS